MPGRKRVLAYRLSSLRLSSDFCRLSICGLQQILKKVLEQEYTILEDTCVPQEILVRIIASLIILAATLD